MPCLPSSLTVSAASKTSVTPHLPRNLSLEQESEEVVRLFYIEATKKCIVAWLLTCIPFRIHKSHHN